MSPAERTVILRSERRPDGSSEDRARVDADGNLNLEGQDIGPMTAMVSASGEYEWTYTIAVSDVPTFVASLGGSGDEDALAFLEREWSGPRAAELGQRLRSSGVAFSFLCWP